jgi:UDP-N-acetylglucosamine 2-epimerase
LLSNSQLVVTDSGGVQREAYLLRKPVVVLRRVTEWVELVESGLALVVDVESGLDPERVLDWRPSGYVEGLLGDEQAPMKIAKILKEYAREAMKSFNS